jgi:hypothetical protein
VYFGFRSNLNLVIFVTFYLEAGSIGCFTWNSLSEFEATAIDLIDLEGMRGDVSLNVVDRLVICRQLAAMRTSHQNLGKCGEHLGLQKHRHFEEEALGLLDPGNVPTLLEYREFRMCDAAIELFGDRERANPVMAPNNNQSVGADLGEAARLNGATATVGRLLCVHDVGGHHIRVVRVDPVKIGPVTTLSHCLSER